LEALARPCSAKQGRPLEVLRNCWPLFLIYKKTSRQPALRGRQKGRKRKRSKVSHKNASEKQALLFRFCYTKPQATFFNPCYFFLLTFQRLALKTKSVSAAQIIFFFFLIMNF
jgi:hypothetical protein